jgi:hypothetical protein
MQPQLVLVLTNPPPQLTRVAIEGEGAALGERVVGELNGDGITTGAVVIGTFVRLSVGADVAPVTEGAT